VLSETEGAVGHFSTRTPAGTDVSLAGAHVSFSPTLAAGQAHQASFRVYAGPLDADALEAIDPTLGDAIDLGFFAFFGYPLLWLLRFYQSFVINWGVAIILLTLTVKLAFFRMTQNSYRSMQRMQQIQPEMTRIREEYADEPQEMNRLTMELMAREKVNPLAGCLPMVAQMPVWFALYQVLLSSVDLYHTDFLYLRDLSAPDPYCILPLIVVALMMIQQQFTNTANMDPAQARVMRFMPLMFGLFFFTFPAGLALYMFVNMTLSILQQWWIKRSLGDAPAAAAA
jgi:YidC/Oxa1 family membrane protein insertase